MPDARDHSDDAFEEQDARRRRRPRDDYPEDEEPRRRRPRDDYDDYDEPRRRTARGDGPILSRADLRQIAIYQKVLIFTILAYVGTYVFVSVVPEQLRLVAALVVAIPVGLTGAVFVFLLSTKVFPVMLGILLGILTFVPCVGLLVIVIVNGRATRLLNRHGYNVGFMGANLADFSDDDRRERRDY